MPCTSFRLISGRFAQIHRGHCSGGYKTAAALRSAAYLREASCDFAVSHCMAFPRALCFSHPCYADADVCADKSKAARSYEWERSRTEKEPRGLTCVRLRGS